MAVPVVNTGGQVFDQCRLIFTAIRDPDADSSPEIQLAEVEFFDGSGNAIAVSSTTNPSGNNPSAEGPEKASDGSTSTKWLDFDWVVPQLTTKSFAGPGELHARAIRPRRNASGTDFVCL